LAKVRGAVYSPPLEGLPPVAVILYDNEVAGARAVPSVEDGDAFLAFVVGAPLTRARTRARVSGAPEPNLERPSCMLQR